MNAMKKVMALLLVFTLVVSCLPLGAVTAFAAETDGSQNSAADVTSDLTENATEPTTEPPTESAEAPAEGTEPVLEPAFENSAESPPEVMMFSASPASEDSDGGSSGSETGDGGDGSGNAAGDGSNNMIAVGVTMQIVYYRYDQCYNRYNSHGNVINTLQSGQAIPWNDTGKDQGASTTTVFDTFTISPNTFIVKARWNSYPYVSAWLLDSLRYWHW